MPRRWDKYRPVSVFPVRREFGRDPLELHRAALPAASGPKVDDPVRPGDHVQIVLDDDHG